MASLTRPSQPKSERSIFLGDIHFPYQDDKALKLVENFARWFNPDAIFLIGDMLDFYALSSFDKDPTRILSLQEEIDQAVTFLRRLRKHHPDATIVFLEGNHEDRLSRYLKKHPEISSLKCLSLPSLLELDSLNISHYPYRKAIVYQDFVVEHGHVVRQNSAYSAKAMLDKRHMSGITGHTHRLGVCHQTTQGTNNYWVENGCLCELNPEYMHGYPDWQHGFSVGYLIDEVPDLIVKNIPIHNYKIFYEEKLFSL